MDIYITRFTEQSKEIGYAAPGAPTVHPDDCRVMRYLERTSQGPALQEFWRLISFAPFTAPRQMARVEQFVYKVLWSLYYLVFPPKYPAYAGKGRLPRKHVLRRCIKYLV